MVHLPVHPVRLKPSSYIKTTPHVDYAYCDRRVEYVINNIGAIECVHGDSRRALITHHIDRECFDVISNIAIIDNDPSLSAYLFDCIGHFRSGTTRI